MPALVQNVCFECRKVFKKPEVPYYYEAPIEKQRFYDCPDCGKKMQYMGDKFRAPAKKDIKEWERIHQAIKEKRDWGISNRKNKN